MDIRCELKRCANMLSYILNMGSIATISEKPMDSNEQGFSGAAIIRLDVVFNDGRKGSFIAKKAELKERMAMQTLTEQGHLYTPAAYSDNLVSDEPVWMIQQDLGKRVHAPYGDQKWMENVAEALVEIHGRNMNRGEEMPWLPHADANYWKKIVTQISVDHFERAVCEDGNFAREFEKYLPKLRAAGNAFACDMTALYKEKQWLTLTHGDLQNIEGKHVYNIEGKPYIIDFGFVRYAPFYIDLVDYFSFENVALMVLSGSVLIHQFMRKWCRNWCSKIDLPIRFEQKRFSQPFCYSLCTKAAFIMASASACLLGEVSFQSASIFRMLLISFSSSSSCRR